MDLESSKKESRYSVTIVNDECKKMLDILCELDEALTYNDHLTIKSLYSELIITVKGGKAKQKELRR